MLQRSASRAVFSRATGMGRTGTPVGKNPYHPFPSISCIPELGTCPSCLSVFNPPCEPMSLAIQAPYIWPSTTCNYLEVTTGLDQESLKRPLASQDSEQIRLVLGNLNSARLSDHFEDDSPSPILISKYGFSEPWNATFFHEKIAMHWMCVSPNSYALDIFAAEVRCHETRALGFSSWSPFHHRKLGIPWAPQNHSRF